MRKGQRPGRHFRKIKTRKGKKIYLINKDVSPAVSRRAYRKGSKKKDEGMDIISMLDAAGLDPKSEEGKSAIATLKEEKGASIEDASSALNKKVRPSVVEIELEELEEPEWSSYEDMVSEGKDPIDIARTMRFKQMEENIRLANAQKAEIKQKEEEAWAKLDDYDRDEAFLDSLNRSRVNIKGDTNFKKTYDYFLGFKGDGYDDDTAARLAAEKRKEELDYANSPDGFESLVLAPLRNIEETKKAKQDLRARNLKYRDVDVTASLFDRLMNVDSKLDELELSEQELSKIKEKDKGLADKVQNRAKFLSGLLQMPEDIKNSPSKRADWIKKNVLAAPPNTGKVERAEFVSEFIRDDKLAKRVAEGDIPKDVLERIENLGLFTNNKGEVDERRLKRFASAFVESQDELKKGKLSPGVKDTFRSLQVDFDEKAFKEGKSGASPGFLASVLLSSNKDEASSVKKKLSNFDNLSSKAVNPDLRKAGSSFADKLKQVYAAYEKEYADYSKSLKDTRSDVKESKALFSEISKGSSKKTKKGFDDYAWLNSLPASESVDALGIKVPKRVREEGESSERSWVLNKLVSTGKLKPLYDQYKLEEKWSKDILRQEASLKQLDDLKRALISKGVDVRGLNARDIRREAKELDIPIRHPSTFININESTSMSPEARSEIRRGWKKEIKEKKSQASESKEAADALNQRIKENEAKLAEINKRLERLGVKSEKRKRR